MGYAGYVPAKLAPEKPTDLQAALWQISQTEALDTLEKLVQNVAKAPTEPKYRKIRLSNPKITTAVIQTPGSLAALQLMGWEASVEDDSLVLPSNRQITFAQARMIDDARQRLVKLQKEAARKKTVAKAPVTKEQLALRAQMEADRRERAGMAPSQGSRAQSLPGGNMAGQAMQLKNLGAAAPDEEE